MSQLSQLKMYLYLARLDKPLPILLLLWPTLFALWLAGSGHPDNCVLLIFIAGVVLMRSAGCVLNDIIDRHIDAHVKRTAKRPLASKKISVKNAFLFATLLMAGAFLLVLFCNRLTITLAIIGALLTSIYPFLKRVTQLPQAGLGIAFSWGVPMAFAAMTNTVDSRAWFLFATCALWPLIYDTMYAMADREDDIKIGVKSTAILFGMNEKWIIALLQCVFIVMMIVVGFLYHLHTIFYYSLIVVALLFLQQQYQIRHRDPLQCLRAFKNNHWVGFAIFSGIFASFW